MAACRRLPADAPRRARYGDPRGHVGRGGEAVRSGPYRLERGGRIDRSRCLSFRFDGRSYQGHPGDTLASALLANGVRIVGRSFKYHRPRGIVTAGPEEPCALVELRTGARREANVPMTTVELFDGLEASSQNRWPSLAFDLGAVNGLLAPLIPAGFYYKTFMWSSALLGAGLRADDPACGRVGRAAASRTRSLRDDQCPSRPGW